MDWLVEFGYFGLFIGTFLAGTILPLSSDVIMIGVLSLGGNPWLCLLSATLGSWSGTMLTYGMGWLGKWDWIERWFKVKKERLDRQKKKIDRYGVWIAFFSWLPVVGAIFTLTLGFYKVKPKLVALFILAGCFVRFLVWTLLYIFYADRFIEIISAWGG